MEELISPWTILTYNRENYYSGLHPFSSNNLHPGRKGLVSTWERASRPVSTGEEILEHQSKSSMYSVLQSKSSLKKDDEQQLAPENGMEYKTIEETYNCLVALSQLEEQVAWLGYEKEKHENHNSLQDNYQMIFDPKDKEK